jgi:hypothetical protein
MLGGVEKKIFEKKFANCHVREDFFVIFGTVKQN